MNILKILFVFSLCVVAGVVSAQSQDDIAAFKMMLNVKDVPIVVPTVGEVSLTGISLERRGFMVYETKSDSYIPYYFKEQYLKQRVPMRASSYGVDTPDLLDEDITTGVDYALGDSGYDSATIIIESKGDAVASSRLIIDLAENVTLPETIKIVATLQNGTERIVVGERAMTSNIIDFPKTTAKGFEIIFGYSQPVRINELRIVQDDIERTSSHSLRFLMQPKSSYTVYYNPDRSFNVTTSESGDLMSDEGVYSLSLGMPKQNPAYVVADVDEDNIVDVDDNCPDVSNSDQEDLDDNGRGDVCDDFDRDGIPNSTDNCPSNPNMYQDDEDGDEIGDACDDAESRITERYTWIPWVGMGIALVVIIGLFVIVGIRPKNDSQPMA